MKKKMISNPIIKPTRNYKTDDQNYNTSRVLNVANFYDKYHESDEEISLNMLVSYFVGKCGIKWFRKNLLELYVLSHKLKLPKNLA